VKLLTVDFETYYDKEYSLSKMTAEEYIRDSRFEAIGVSVQEGELSPVWFSGTHAQTKAFLDQFDWGDAAAVAHNAMFDMAILSWHFDIRPKKIVNGKATTHHRGGWQSRCAGGVLRAWGQGD
jgi:hypothetical protein